MEAVVEFEYKAEQEDELSLKVGDIITNVQTAEGGWWEGELNGKKGMFPENFVKLVKLRDAAVSKIEGKREATQRKSVRELANKFKDGVPMGIPPKKKEKKKRCKVLFEYKRENDDELDLAVGEIVEFHKQVEEGWWEGTLNGKHGVFPSNFVEMIEETGSSDESAPHGSVDDKEKEKEKAAGDVGNKDGEFHTIKGKKVKGVGLGNIFGSGPIKLRSTAEKGNSKDDNKIGKTEPDAAPEVAKREKPNAVEKAVVRFSYAAEQPDELSLTEGQFVRIIDKELEDEGWWKGEVNGKVGVFPDNFVELLPTEEPNKPKKPPPPSAAAKQSLQPKLPDKSPASDLSEDKMKAEPQAPAIGKKPQAPPPIGKKPLSQKPEAAIPNRAVGSVKDNKLSKENHVNDQHSEEPAQFDSIEPGSQKLTHLTANRAKGPKKRPPSTQPQPPSEPEPAMLHHRDREPHSGAPPPRPPEPTSAPPSHTTSASSIQMNKLIENLQRELNELKANTVSRAAFNELRAEHEKLKTEFESVKASNSKKFRELMNEVDEEKKIRLTTQVEIERVKKFMAETNV